jgi:hypothetical protein
MYEIISLVVTEDGSDHVCILQVFRHPEGTLNEG